MASGFLTKDRLTHAQVLEQRLADTELHARFEEPLNVHHHRKLAKTTLKNHALILKYWTEFVTYYQSKPPIIAQKYAYLSAKIAPDCMMPSAGMPFPISYVDICIDIYVDKCTCHPEHIKEFVRWMAMSLVGRLDTYISKNTLSSYVRTFLGFWAFYAGLLVPPQTRMQVLAYLHSEDMVVQLTTKIRKKPVADIVDVNILIRAMWLDSTHFRTSRMQLQLIYTSLLSAVSGERPGALVEASGYRHSDQAITHGDHSVWIIPSQKTIVVIAIVIRIRLLKGHRDDDSFYKEFIIFEEPSDRRSACSAMLYLAMALEDNVFEDVQTIDQIFVSMPERSHHLTIKEDKKALPLLRNEERSPDGWQISADKPLPYYRYLSLLALYSELAGFEAHVTPYCFRRGAANIWSSELTEEQRKLLLGHTPNSGTFYNSYQSRLSTTDVQGVQDERGQRVEVIDLIKSIGRMSSTIDPNAPTQLTLAERNALLTDPVILALLERKVELECQVSNLCDQLASGNSKHNDASLLLQIEQTREEIKQVAQKRDTTLRREEDQRLQIMRKNYFAKASFRALNKSAPEKPIKLMAATFSGNDVSNLNSPGAEAGSFSNQSIPMTAPSSDPYTSFLCHIYPSDIIGTDSKHLATSITMLLKMPKRPFPKCYPGEMPTLENKCPNLPRMTAGAHIHTCLQKQKIKDASAALDENYIPGQCLWLSCKQKMEIFPDRKAFLKHLDRHLASLHSRVSLPSCKWQVADGVPCGQDECDDWNVHFAEAHAINVEATAHVQFCYFCDTWNVDLSGDKHAWHDHLIGHYGTLYRPFAVRQTDHVDVTPSITGLLEAQGSVEFDIEEGFGGKRPEFHGHIESGIAFTPMICPWCVYNEELPMIIRMMQFASNQAFVHHLSYHKKQLTTIIVHMICYHQVPICRTERCVQVRRLRLPTKDNKVDVDSDSEVDMMSNKVTETNTSGREDELSLRRMHGKTFFTDPQELETIAGPSNNSVQGQRKKKCISPTEEHWRCSGCHHVYINILDHIRDATQACCRDVAAYRAFDMISKKTIGEDITWLPDNSASSSKKRCRTSDTKGPPKHYCPSHRRQFHDIREHMPNLCKNKTFRIRDESVSRSIWGPSHDFATWAATAPPFEKDD
ncbi:hypothetical protein A0H81_07058 [Grifola frondosa]|uniref:C2H2-type domain-containing protein n=1 Tax=Grifola frondosa TaxID=5627 RepID=A0A1C7M9E3_GRIFR|nr:hypothetical protein A0H81_07058 [Grifola frondosa]